MYTTISYLSGCQQKSIPCLAVSSFLVLLLLWSVQPAAVSAQSIPANARQVHTINYAAGVIKAQWIPYGRRWAIQGNTLKLENEIKVVVGELRQHGRRSTTRSCWNNPPDVNTDVFRLVFEPLDLGKRYDLDLEFYGGFDFTKLAPALDIAYAEAEAHANTTYPLMDRQTVKDLFNQTVQQEIERIFREEEIIMIRDVMEGSCEVVEREQTYVPGVELDRSMVNQIADVVLTDVRAQRRASLLDEIESTNRNLIVSTDYESLNQTLEQEEVRTFGFLAPGDASSLRAALNASGVPPDDVLARLHAMREACQTDAAWSDSECTLLGEIVERAFALQKESSVQESEYIPVRAQILKQIGDYLSEMYTPMANTRINAISWNDAQSTSDQLRVSTAISLGAAGMNLTPGSLSDFEFQDTESFAMFALKFYPYNVDKRLHRPYMGGGILGRTSLFGGLLLRRDLRWRDFEMNGAALGLYPALGAGVDLTKHITLQVGAVFFRQPTFISGSDDSEFKAAPMMAFGFDFDGFNRIRNAVLEARR